MTELDRSISSKLVEGTLILKLFSMRLCFTLWWQLCQCGVVILWRKRMGGDESIWRPLLQWTSECIVFVLFAPCCSNHWISSQRQRETHRERELGLNNTLLFLQQQCHWLLSTYSKSQRRCHHPCGIPRITHREKNTELDVRGLCLKGGLGTISGYIVSGENKEKWTCYLQNTKINKTVWKEEASLDCT